MSYEWVKVVHLLAVIAWMAGLFYLPRLMVYHSGEAVGSSTSEVFKTMERRLLRAIMRPSAVVVAISGLGLWHMAGFAVREPWFLAKLLGVGAMFVFHGLLERYVRAFGVDQRPGSGRFFRVINEVPTVILIWIVIWVVVKPLA